MTDNDIKKIYELFLKYPVINTDSRKVEQGSLFFALKGENFDGNQFAGTAISNGAAYAVVDNSSLVKDDRYILVDDALRALQLLAQYHRRKYNIPFIGITGSNGKTTTKELMTSVLSQKYEVISTSGNFNNHIGVPLTLLQLNNKHEIAVIEMGANHRGEIDTLCEIVKPGYGIITNVGKAHLEGFGSFEGVKKTKKELYDHIRKVNGSILINIEDDDLRRMAEGINKITYGYTNKKAEVFAQQIKAEPFLSIVWKSWKYKQSFRVQTKLLGDYNWSNVMAAITAGILFGIEPEEINSAVAAYDPSNNRSQFLKTSSNEIILDAYNANPTSMEKALQNFFKLKKNNKCLILGDMMELGEESRKEHESILKIINRNRQEFDKVFLVGEQFEALQTKDAITFNSTDSIKAYLREKPLKSKTILVKGSRGNHLETLTEVL